MARANCPKDLFKQEMKLHEAVDEEGKKKMARKVKTQSDLLRRYYHATKKLSQREWINLTSLPTKMAVGTISEAYSAHFERAIHDTLSEVAAKKIACNRPEIMRRSKQLKERSLLF